MSLTVAFIRRGSRDRHPVISRVVLGALRPQISSDIRCGSGRPPLDVTAPHRTNGCLDPPPDIAALPTIRS